NLFQLANHLANQLFVLRGIVTRFVAGKTLASSANGEPLLIQKRSNLADHQYILALVITSIASPFDRVELWKLLLPVSKYVWLHRTEFTHFSNREVTFARYDGKLVIMTWFQHRPRPWL